MDLLINVHETNQNLYASIQVCQPPQYIKRINIKETSSSKLQIIIDLQVKKFAKQTTLSPFKGRIELCDHLCNLLLTQMYELGLTHEILYMKKNPKYTANKFYAHFVKILRMNEIQIKYI
mgnify:CR=1 FL=1